MAQTTGYEYRHAEHHGYGANGAPHEVQMNGTVLVKAP